LAALVPSAGTISIEIDFTSYRRSRRHPHSHVGANGARWRILQTSGRKIMKTYLTVTFAMLAGAGLGAAAVQGLHAQAKAPVYLVTEIDVTNPEAYGKEYAPKAQALIKASGGRFLAIGGTAGAGAGKVTAFDGEAPKRATVQVWDSMEQYQAYRNLPAFKEAREIGVKYAKFHTFAVDGVPQ
jgi:uncharacterized protein (DUF1330 family)